MLIGSHSGEMYTVVRHVFDTVKGSAAGNGGVHPHSQQPQARVNDVSCMG